MVWSASVACMKIMFFLSYASFSQSLIMLENYQSFRRLSLRVYAVERASDRDKQPDQKSNWLDRSLSKVTFGYQPDVDRRNYPSLLNDTNKGVQTSEDFTALSKEHYDSVDWVKMSCEKGHTWTAVRGSPMNFYCPKCAASPRKRVAGGRSRRMPSSLASSARNPYSSAVISLAELRKCAEEKGGEVLAIEWLREGSNSDDSWLIPLSTMARFRCGQGHEWQAHASNILKRGFWCPRCAAVERHDQRGRLTIEDMRKTAQTLHGGECLSTEYLGSAVKLQWQCSEGHVFWQTPNNVRRRTNPSWCRKCSLAHRQRQSKIEGQL